MGKSLVSRHYQDCIKRLEKKGIFKDMSSEKVTELKTTVHDAIRHASMMTALRG